MRYAVPKKTSISLNGNYKHHKKVYNTVVKNQNKVFKNLLEGYSNILGVNSIEKLRSVFALNGAYLLKELDDLNYPSNQFLLYDPSKFFYKKHCNDFLFYSRGASYVVALDPSYSVLQKLAVLFKDLLHCKKYLEHYKINDTPQHRAISVILDYLKNSLITLFNAYVHKEKIGQFKLADTDYQINRSKLVDSLCIAVYAYHLSLTNELSEEILTELKESLDIANIEYINNLIKNDYRNFSFSSRSVKRPEAIHPLVLYGFAYLLAKKNPKCDLVFGIPAGGTEVAALVYMMIKKKSNSNCKLLLAPISLHSIKDTGFEYSEDGLSNLRDLLTEVNPELVKSILIVDDNSATGGTMQKIFDIVTKYFHCNIKCYVAEADLVRIDQKINDSDGGTLAHPDLFKYSMNILPISKTLWPKYDLKELQEREMLRRFYLNKKASCLASKIVNEVTADALANTEDNRNTMAIHSDIDAILSFKHTFLSNFYGVYIDYRGRKYSSVEQAYLRQKFDSNTLSKLNIAQKRELNEILRIKGIPADKNNFLKVFHDFSIPAGVLKRWSIKLKEWGFEDQSWDEKRLLIMTELLLLKFSDPELKKLLLETGDKYLIEGNDWNDTFWGVCNNRGTNFLGRLLMNIRYKILHGEIDERMLRIYR